MYLIYLIFDRYPDYIDDTYCNLPAMKTRTTTTMESWAWWRWWQWGWWACWRWSRWGWWAWWRWAWWRWWQFHDGNAARMNLWLEKQKLSLLLHKRREAATMKMMRIEFKLFLFLLKRGKKKIWIELIFVGTKEKIFSKKIFLCALKLPASTDA